MDKKEIHKCRDCGKKIDTNTKYNLGNREGNPPTHVSFIDWGVNFKDRNKLSYQCIKCYLKQCTETNKKNFSGITDIIIDAFKATPTNKIIAEQCTLKIIDWLDTEGHFD